MEEDESNDYDSYLSSSHSEDQSLVKRGWDNAVGDEEDDNDEIDVDKLDFEDRALLARVNALKEYLPKYQIKNQPSSGSPRKTMET